MGMFVFDGVVMGYKRVFYKLSYGLKLFLRGTGGVNRCRELRLRGRRLGATRKKRNRKEGDGKQKKDASQC
jgi:hypothetical protein